MGGGSRMRDDVVPPLAPKENIPLPFVEPRDDLLRVGEEPPSPTDYFVRQVTQIEPTVRPRRLSRSLEATQKTTSNMATIESQPQKEGNNEFL